MLAFKPFKPNFKGDKSTICALAASWSPCIQGSLKLLLLFFSILIKNSYSSFETYFRSSLGLFHAFIGLLLEWSILLSTGYDYFTIIFSSYYYYLVISQRWYLGTRAGVWVQSKGNIVRFGGNLAQLFRHIPWTPVPSFPQIPLLEKSTLKC